ncbi:MAG: SpoIVB peptidase [Porcipelethomonas sp.]
MKKFFKISFGLLTLSVINICTVAGYYAVNLPDSYYIQKGENLELSTVFDISADPENEALASFAGEACPASRSASLKLFGVIPVKNVELHTVDTPVLVPGGDPFGIKLLMDGVMVIGTGEVKCKDGMASPANDCGIEKGDVILTIDGQEITSNADIQDAISASDGEPVEIKYMRNEKVNTVSLTPVFSLKDSSYKAGMWVRDSTAGVGTVTFYEPGTGRFGGLGHPVCDTDTGEIVPISSGEAVDVQINGVIPGTEGSPGELRGSFISDRSSGVIYFNNKYGVYGEMLKPVSGENAIPMGLKQEVRTGPAEIYTTINDKGPQKFQISIEKINQKNSDTKNMVIRVTDQELLSETGGIVQGMSGSPIIQNGKLIGAVTHVFVSDPTMGYAIFCENMYESGISN